MVNSIRETLFYQNKELNLKYIEIKNQINN